jgi:hypothetical protein
MSRISGFPRSDQAAGAAFPSVGVVVILSAWRRLRTTIFDPYRPELHYMRGPGPKWRERHGIGP